VALFRVDPDSEAVERLGGASVHLGAGFRLVADRLGAWMGVRSHLVRVDSSTQVTVRRRVAYMITDLQRARNGLWVTDSGSNEVVRVDPRTGAIRERITVPGAPRAVAVDRGVLWVAADDPQTGAGHVYRIDPASGQVAATVDLVDRPTDLAAGEGSLWVATDLSGAVHRIDPMSNRIVATIPLGNRPDGIAVGEGFVWVTVY
jgi:streptogramin lyase